MATFSLDDIRAAADKKYGSTDIPFGDGKVVKLANPLRLSKAKRDTLSSIGDRMDAEGVDQAEVLEDAIRTAAEPGSEVEALIEAIGGDLAVLVTLFENYTSGVQAGEASASQS